MSRRKKRDTGPNGAPKPWSSAILNNETYQDYYHRLKSIAINRFEWQGLPEEVDERFIEKGLFEKGYMLFFKDGEEVGYACLKFNPGGIMTIYDVPTQREAYASNGQYLYHGTDKNSVIIYNNFERLADMPTTILFAMRIADIQRSIDTNVIGQKTPKLLTAPESQRLALKNLYMQVEGNEPYIFGDDIMREELKIEVLDTTAPYVADKLEIQKHQMMNEYLSYLGIENNNASDKKERLVADEVTSNYGLVENSRNVALNARLQACEQINKMFGLNVSVKFKSEVQTKVNKPNLEGEENGEIYN